MATKTQGLKLPARTSQGPTKATAKKAAPAVIEQAAVVIDTIPTVAEVRQAIAEHGKLYFDGDEAAGESILAGVLDCAKSGEDLFAESELAKVEDHYGETLVVQSINGVLNSTFEGGLGVFLIVTVVDQQGEVFRMAVGQTDPLAKLVALHEFGQLPWAVCFELSEKATKSGFHPVNLLSRQVKGGGQPF